MDLSVKKIIKVCKVDNFDFAKYAIHSGVNYLGIHILEKEDIGDHLKLIQYIKKSNGKVIILTKIRNFNEIKEIINLYRPQGIQLHYQPDINILSKLKTDYPALEIFSVITDEITVEEIESIEKYVDKIIYDTSFVGGTGISNPLKLLNLLPKYILSKVLIAGGVNVGTVIAHKDSEIAGYDIQSYFRDKNNRYFNRLETIMRVLGYKKARKLLISLTDISLDEIVQKINYPTQPQTGYHLDYSDKSLYASFSTQKEEVLQKTKLLKNYPHTIHIFQNSIELVNKSITDFIKNNPYSIVAFFIQYFDGIDLDQVNKEVNLTVSIYYKDLRSYAQKYSNKFSHLSVILPTNDIKKTIEIIGYINDNRAIFSDCEIWFDREMDISKIKLIKEHCNLKFNVVVGKEITKNGASVDEMYKEITS